MSSILAPYLQVCRLPYEIFKILLGVTLSEVGRINNAQQYADIRVL